MTTEAANGLFYSLNYFIRQMAYVASKEYIPLVDMKYHENLYLEKEKLGHENSWEYYYQQLADYDLSEVYESKSVIIADSPMDTYFYNGFSNTTRSLVYNKYFQPNNALQTRWIEKKAELFREDKKYLGIICRGTDYANGYHPYKHPIPLDANEMLEITQQYLANYGYDYVYLSTEDEKIFETFKNSFGDRLCSFEQKRYSDDTDRKLVDVIGSENTGGRRELGNEYFLTIALLANCDSLIGTHCAGLRGAITLNAGKYEHIKVVNKGLWGVVDENNAIIIESTNRNLLDFSLGFKNTEKNGVKITYSENGRIRIVGKADKQFDIYIARDQDTLLPPDIYGYAIEDTAESAAKSIQIFCRLYYEDGSDELLINRGKVRTKKNVVKYSTVLRVKEDVEIDCNVGFSIGLLDIPDEYVKHLCSYTTVGLYDEEGNKIELSGPSISVNLEAGYILKNHDQIWMKDDCYLVFRGVVKYRGGIIRKIWQGKYLYE